MNLLTVLAVICFANCGIAPASAWFGNHNRQSVVVEENDSVDIPIVELPIKEPFHFAPVLEIDPDKREIEYRVQLQEGNLLDLSCRPLETPLAESVYEQRKTIESNGDHLKFYQKKHFPFQWTKASKNRLPAQNPVIGGYDTSGAPFFICRQSYGPDYCVIGMVSLRNGVCQVYRNGGYTSEANYDLLINPSNVKYTWAKVSNWEQVPESTFVISRPSITERRYIGKGSFAKRGEIILDVPQNCETVHPDDLEPYPSEFTDRLDNETFQVLVPQENEQMVTAETEYQVDLQSSSDASSSWVHLVCKATNETFNQEEFTEELDIIVTKVAGSQQTKGNNTLEWKVFKKVEKPSLAWKEATSAHLVSENPIFGGRDDNGTDTYICRYRCTADTDCPSFRDYLNGEQMIGTIDKTIGFVSLRTGLCYVEFNEGAYTTEQYDVLTNPGNLVVSWKSVTTPTNGTVAIQQNGEKNYIGRLPTGDSLPIGHVDLSSGQIHFTQGETPIWKDVDETVCVLTVQV